MAALISSRSVDCIGTSSWSGSRGLCGEHKEPVIGGWRTEAGVQVDQDLGGELGSTGGMVDRQKREETEQPNGWEQQYQFPRRFQQEPVDAESHRSRDQDREDERSKATMNALLFVSYAGLSVNKL
jgi:hypothetical protein